MNLEGKTWGDPENWDKARKKDLTEKSPEEDKGQNLASETKGDKCDPSRDRMRPSKSSISKSDRLRRKFKFQLVKRWEFVEFVLFKENRGVCKWPANPLWNGS